MSSHPAIFSALSRSVGENLQTESCTCLDGNGCIKECNAYPCQQCAGIEFDPVYGVPYPPSQVYRDYIPQFKIFSSANGPLVTSNWGGGTQIIRAAPPGFGPCNHWEGGCQSAGPGLVDCPNCDDFNQGALSPSCCPQVNPNPNSSTIRRCRMFPNILNTNCVITNCPTCIHGGFVSYYGHCTDDDTGMDTCVCEPTGSYTNSVEVQLRSYRNPAGYEVDVSVYAERTVPQFGQVFFSPGCHDFFVDRVESPPNTEVGYYDCNGNWNGSGTDYINVDFTVGCAYGFTVKRGSVFDESSGPQASCFGENCAAVSGDEEDDTLEGKPLETAYESYPDFFGIGQSDQPQDQDDPEYNAVLGVLPFLDDDGLLEKRKTLIIRAAGGGTTLRKWSGFPDEGCECNSYGYYTADCAADCCSRFQCPNTFNLLDGDVGTNNGPPAPYFVTGGNPGVTYFLYQGCYVETGPGSADPGLPLIRYDLIGRVGYANGMRFAGCVEGGCEDGAFCGDDDPFGNNNNQTRNRQNGVNAEGDWRKIPGHEYRFGCIKGRLSPPHSITLSDFSVPVFAEDFYEQP